MIDFDDILVMDGGSVAEFGPPWQLLRNPDGMFAQLVAATGRREVVLSSPVVPSALFRAVADGGVVWSRVALLRAAAAQLRRFHSAGNHACDASFTR